MKITLINRNSIMLELDCGIQFTITKWGEYGIKIVPRKTSSLTIAGFDTEAKFLDDKIGLFDYIEVYQMETEGKPK